MVWFCQMLEGNPGFYPKAIHAHCGERQMLADVSYSSVTVVWFKDRAQPSGPYGSGLRSCSVGKLPNPSECGFSLYKWGFQAPSHGRAEGKMVHVDIPTTNLYFSIFSPNHLSQLQQTDLVLCSSLSEPLLHFHAPHPQYLCALLFRAAPVTLQSTALGLLEPL